MLPFAEIWNEPIATYVGDLVMADVGYKDEAMRRIKGTIERASRIDATMKLYDLDGTSHSGAPKLEGGKANDMHWGKALWVLEQLRAQEPEVLARYSRAKRQLAKPGALTRYDANATVAVLSVAMKRDLFPWFRGRSGLTRIAPSRPSRCPIEACWLPGRETAWPTGRVHGDSESGDALQDPGNDWLFGRTAVLIPSGKPSLIVSESEFSMH